MGFLFTVFAGLQITQRELQNLEPYEINNPDTLSIYWSPITAIALIIAGIVVLILSRKENKIAHR